MAGLSAAGVSLGNFGGSNGQQTPAVALLEHESWIDFIRKLGAPVCPIPYRVGDDRERCHMPLRWAGVHADASPIAEVGGAGDVGGDSDAGVHDDLGGNIDFTAWRPASRLKLHVLDDDVMTATGMRLERPRSGSHTPDGLGNRCRWRVLATGRAGRADAGARRQARGGASARRA